MVNWILLKLVTKYGQHFYKHDLKIVKQIVGVPLRSPSFFIGYRIQYKIIQLFNYIVAMKINVNKCTICKGLSGVYI